MRKLSFVFSVFSLLLATVACGKENGEGATGGNNAKVAVTGVTLPAATAIPVGGSTKLTASVLPANATNAAVTWTRLNGTGSVSVDAEGNVTGDGAGSAKVTATTVDGSFKAVCNVTVDAALVAVTGVSIPETLSVGVGGSMKLPATVLPADASNKQVTWSAANGTGSVTVDTEGNVTGRSAGTATVTATTVEGGFTTSCTVTVGAATVAVTGVTLPQTLDVPLGGSVKLTASVLPAGATNSLVTWSRTNGTGSVSVDSEGNVSGLGAGTATVTVTTVEGGFTASCAVTVSAVADVTGKYYFSSSAGSDSNTGKSPSSPWQNLSKINGTTFMAGDSIFLKSGDVWTGPFEFVSKFTGTEQNPIVITSYGAGNKPRITATGGTAVLTVANSDYLKIKNIEVGPGNAYGLLCGINDRRDHSHITVEEVHVRDLPAAGIWFIADNNTNRSNDVVIKNCTADKAEYLFAITAGDNLQISGCTATNCGYGGFSLISVNGGSLDNCKVSNCGTGNYLNGACGIFLGITEDFLISNTEVCYQKRQGTNPDAEAIDFERDCHRVTVRGCNLHHNDGGAMMFFDSGSSTQVNSSCVVENTVFDNNGANAFNPRGFEIHYTALINNNNGIIRNNTFKLRDGWGMITTVDPSVTVSGNKDGSGNALPQAPAAQAAPVFKNAGFEDFALANGQYLYWAPTQGAWTFRGNGGVSTYGADFSLPSSGLVGRQAAFLQGAGMVMSQAVNLNAGSYKISFAGAYRSTGAALGVEIYVDGVQVGSTLTPAGATGFNTLTSSAFSVASGLHLVEFRSSGSSGDRTVYIDEVKITAQ